MKKLPAMLIAVSMIFALAACTPGRDSSRGESADAQPTPLAEEKLSYSATFRELGGLENFISLRCAGEDGFYATAAVMTSNTIPAGVTPEYETQFYNYQQRLYLVGLDGTVSRLRGYKPPELESQPDNALDYSQSHTIAAMLINDDGELTSIEYVDESWYRKIVSAAGKESRGDYIIRQRWFVRRLSESGAELGCAQIKLDEDETVNGRYPVNDGSGGIILTDSDGLRCVSMEGETLWRTAAPEAVGNLVRLGDGSIYALSWDGSWSARSLDISTKTLGERVRLPEEALSVFPGKGGTFYYNDDNRLWSFDPYSGEKRETVNWLDCDIIMENIGGLQTMTDEGDIAGVMTVYHSDSGGYLTELFVLSPIPDDGAEKKDISLGVLVMDTELRNLVVERNRAGGRRISIVDYSRLEDPATALTTDMKSGKGPDIIYLEGLDAEALAGKGLLEDMYPYMDADGELSRETYFPSFLSVCEYEGALVCASPGFTVSTVIGPKSTVGFNPGWSLEQFDRAAGTMSGECSILEYYSTRDEVLSDCVALCFRELVDTGKGKCDFDNQLFRDILRFASYFPAKYDWNSFTGEAEDSTYYRLREGRQMLSQISIADPEDIFFCDACFDGGAAFIGLPVNSGTGNGLSIAPGYAINAKSANKEEAWDFVKTFLGEDYQRGYKGIAGLSGLFEERLTKAMTISYYTDETGATVTDEDGQPVQKPRCSFGDEDREGDKVQSFYFVTMEQAEALRTLINTTVRTPVYNDDILQIVKNKTVAYFAGTISGELASQAVQKAASDYLAGK